jgi:low temperature requirement protein LtrA
VADAVETSAEPVEKRVSWAELFFDLVFVFAVTEVSTLLEADHSWAGALRALVVFVPIYWAWVGVAIQTNVRDMSTPGLRIGMFAVALAGLFMALAVPDAYGDRALLFALAYWAARLVLGFVGVAHDGWRVNPYTVSMTITGPILVVGALTDGWVQVAIWGLAALIDLSTPTVLRRRLRGMHFDAPHLAERFGLFVLIALGESVVAIGSSAAPAGRLGVAVGLAVAAAFTVSAGLWWVYFNYAAEAVRHALATAQVQLDVTRLVLSYGHLSLIAAIIAVSVGLREAVAHPGTALPPAGVGLLFGGSALYLATFGYTRWMMFHLVSTTRLTAAAVVVLLIVPAAHLPATAALLMLAAVLVALNTVEYLRVSSIGWRALLARRQEPSAPGETSAPGGTGGSSSTSTEP